MGGWKRVSGVSLGDFLHIITKSIKSPSVPQIRCVGRMVTLDAASIGTCKMISEPDKVVTDFWASYAITVFIPSNGIPGPREENACEKFPSS